MTSSDIIALTAIVVSGVVSLVTLITSLITNSTNNRARRSEIAFDKRLDAFSDVFQEISKANDIIYRFSLLISLLGEKQILQKKDESPQMLQTYTTFLNHKDHFRQEYYNKRVYIPPHIDMLIQRYIDEVFFDILDNKKPLEITEHLQRALPLKDKYTDDILAEMHKFIGF